MASGNRPEGALSIEELTRAADVVGGFVAWAALGLPVVPARRSGTAA